MKIVYCVQGMHRRGGIERVITTKANYLADLGYEVHIVTTDQHDWALAFPLSEGVQHHDLGLNYNDDNKLGRWKRMLALYRKRGEHRAKLERLFAEIKPDIVVSTFFQDAEILPTLKDGSKKILELHSSNMRRIAMYPKNQKLLRAYGHIRTILDKRLALKYDKFVVLTHEDRGYWGDMPNITTIHNPRAFTCPEKAMSEREKVVIAVGRYEYGKNWDRLIRLWQPFVQKFPDWRLEIFGSGPLNNSLRKLVSELKVGENVFIKGETHEIYEQYQRASIMVMLSEWEGLPMVLIEGQTSGLPLVSYACITGPRDIITHGKDGYLVEMYDDEAMAKHLTSLMSNDALREEMSREAYLASERFALEGIMKQWIDLFTELTRK